MRNLKAEKISIGFAFLLLLFSVQSFTLACTGPACEPCQQRDIYGHCVPNPPCCWCDECKFVTSYPINDYICVSKCTADQSCCCPSVGCSGCKCCPNNKCCTNGVCPDTCWIRKLKNAETHECPPCNGGCSGYYSHINAYYVCAAGVAGESGWCKCISEKTVIGVRYKCHTIWDITKMLNCAIACDCRALVCLFTGMEDPEPCADCVQEAGLECCNGGTCELCDFIEKCEEDYKTAEFFEGFVMKTFDGHSCNG